MVYWYTSYKKVAQDQEGTHQQLLELHGYYEQLYLHSQGNVRIEAG
ncbi:hypothetical protein FHS14_005681 [Paenibacillus baekrokdamisoli]|nr:hypothetical protein [Paenibacillus baekrokdamisoli]MBB3072647.1 hypothetical protein [Paenibacillus baekrokdamisoli]